MRAAFELAAADRAGGFDWSRFIDALPKDARATAEAARERYAAQCSKRTPEWAKANAINLLRIFLPTIGAGIVKAFVK
jgi:hypothetical protein